VSPAGWRLPAVITGREPLERAALALEIEFRDYHFGICRARDGRALAAVRKLSAAGPGICVVITPDPGEMRRVLLEDEGSPPDSG
jgi:hypothetical protein